MSSLYEHIEQLGATHGYKNITELCRAAGVPRATMTELKMGRSKDLSKPNAQKFADILMVSLDVVYGSEQKETPALTSKDERDIEKRMEAMLEELESTQDDLMFSGEALDPETKELLAASLRNSMQMGKLMAKQKFTPNKYKK